MHIIVPPPPPPPPPNPDGRQNPKRQSVPAGQGCPLEQDWIGGKQIGPEPMMAPQH
jgi:hypothetical protein